MPRKPSAGPPVHPHACGEHPDKDHFVVGIGGSSPRLWGTFLSSRSHRGQSRFIPTPVGNIHRRRADKLLIAVHPHACGEHRGNRYRRAHDHGSSPRLWGTLSLAILFPPLQRFIPTPVGNIGGGPQIPRCFAVHPHACGEHKSLVADVYGHYGSSPRLWGTCHHRQGRHEHVRFIPTPVGNIEQHHGKRCWPAVHPHACGEHRGCARRVASAFGSSPRLWGTYSRGYRRARDRRFIPTPVGNIYALHVSL